MYKRAPLCIEMVNSSIVNTEMCVITESAIVWISKCLNQQTSFQSQQMAGVAKISKCLSQQMSRPSQQMSNQQMSVSKCPVSKWKISKVPDTDKKCKKRNGSRTGETGKQGKSVLIRFQPVFRNKVSTHLDSLTGRC